MFFSSWLTPSSEEKLCFNAQVSDLTAVLHSGALESVWFGLRRSPCLDPQLERRHEQMKRNLEAQYKELEEKRRVFEEEKANWEAQQRILEQQKLDASKSVQLRTLKNVLAC